MRHLLLPVLLLTAGCVDYVSVDYVIDLRAATASVTYQDLRGDGHDDFVTLMARLIPEGTFEAEFPRATVQRKEAVAREGRLDVDVELSLPDPGAARVGAWDAAAPYRLCPPEGAVFVETNASWRDADGCAVWRKGTKVLRARAVMQAVPTNASLLGEFQSWDAAGRPTLSADPQKADPARDPPTP
jgi:hypothetical protein